MRIEDIINKKLENFKKIRDQQQQQKQTTTKSTAFKNPHPVNNIQPPNPFLFNTEHNKNNPKTPNTNENKNHQKTPVFHLNIDREKIKEQTTNTNTQFSATKKLGKTSLVNIQPPNPFLFNTEHNKNNPETPKFNHENNSNLPSTNTTSQKTQPSYFKAESPMTFSDFLAIENLKNPPQTEEERKTALELLKGIDYSNYQGNTNITKENDIKTIVEIIRIKEWAKKNNKKIDFSNYSRNEISKEIDEKIKKQNDEKITNNKEKITNIIKKHPTKPIDKYMAPPMTFKEFSKKNKDNPRPLKTEEIPTLPVKYSEKEAAKMSTYKSFDDYKKEVDSSEFRKEIINKFKEFSKNIVEATDNKTLTELNIDFREYITNIIKETDIETEDYTDVINLFEEVLKLTEAYGVPTNREETIYSKKGIEYILDKETKETTTQENSNTDDSIKNNDSQKIEDPDQKNRDEIEKADAIKYKKPKRIKHKNQTSLYIIEEEEYSIESNNKIIHNPIEGPDQKKLDEIKGIVLRHSNGESYKQKFIYKMFDYITSLKSGHDMEKINEKLQLLDELKELIKNYFENNNLNE